MTTLAVSRTNVVGGSAALNLSPETFHDSGNADKLIVLFGREMRYCHPEHCWYVWDGKRWKRDDTGQARKHAKLAMAECYRQAVLRGDESAQKFFTRSANERQINSLLELAECEIFVEPDKLDAQPYLLNFENGTFDVRTGRLREQDRGDLLTRLIHHPYNPSASCTLWLQTLHRVMGGGPDASEGDCERAARMVDYLQCAFGYSVTGDVREKAVFMCYGENGNNGKTTVLSAIGNAAEEYSVQIDINTLMSKQETNNTQSDLSRLRRARFAKTSETEEGQRLAEGKLKRITQGMTHGKISAVRKYENATEFTETHKLWMDCNHRPVIRGTENAVWNRIRLIPFLVDLNPAEIDLELSEKLEAEAAGILAWVCAGAHRWYLHGLGHPPELDAAKSEYRSDMDPLKEFVDEACIVGEYVTAQSNILYGAYSSWASQSHQPKIFSAKDFRKLLEQKGFRYEHKMSGSQVQGLGLRSRE